MGDHVHIRGFPAPHRGPKKGIFGVASVDDLFNTRVCHTAADNICFLFRISAAHTYTHSIGVALAYPIGLVGQLRSSKDPPSPPTSAQLPESLLQCSHQVSSPQIYIWKHAAQKTQGILKMPAPFLLYMRPEMLQ